MYARIVAILDPPDPGKEQLLSFRYLLATMLASNGSCSNRDILHANCVLFPQDLHSLYLYIDVLIGKTAGQITTSTSKLLRFSQNHEGQAVYSDNASK